MDKKLTRSTDNAMVAGVAAGLANYLNIDTTLIRLAFVLTALLGGPGIFAYIILWIIMPQDNATEKTGFD